MAYGQRRQRSVGRDAVRRATRFSTNLAAVVVTQVEAVGEVRPSCETAVSAHSRRTARQLARSTARVARGSDRSSSPLARLASVRSPCDWCAAGQSKRANVRYLVVSAESRSQVAAAPTSIRLSVPMISPSSLSWLPSLSSTHTTGRYASFVPRPTSCQSSLRANNRLALASHPRLATGSSGP